MHCAKAACSFLQILPGSQIPTSQCYYTVVMAFRGRKKKAACRFLHNQKAACRLGHLHFWPKFWVKSRQSGSKYLDCTFYSCTSWSHRARQDFGRDANTDWHDDVRIGAILCLLWLEAHDLWAGRAHCTPFKTLGRVSVWKGTLSKKKSAQCTKSGMSGMPLHAASHKLSNKKDTHFEPAGRRNSAICQGWVGSKSLGQKFLERSLKASDMLNFIKREIIY